MISWISAAPLLALPALVVFLVGLLPEVSLLGAEVGGGLFRQWLVNHMLLPVLPSADAAAVVAWYMQTDIFGELLLHGLIALNINAVLLPVLYLLLSGYIGLANWATKTDLDLKRQSAKR